MEEVVKELLVAVKERVEFMGQGKDDMEVRGVDDLSPALIHPEFFLDGLAVGAVTVTAGIIMNFKVSAIGTEGGIDAEGTGFAVDDVEGSFLLDMGLEDTGSGIMLIRETPDLLDVMFSQGRHLPSGQRG